MREEFPTPGHFIGADRCRFFRHTHVDGYCISTVGEWYPKSRPFQMETLGVDRFYETMVFPLNAAGLPEIGEEVAMEGYNSAEDAEKGHLRFVERFSLVTYLNKSLNSGGESTAWKP